MNRKLLALLTDSERELVLETTPENLQRLDEDQLIELHDRIRRARNKYTKLFRRQASAQVRADRSRARTAETNTGTHAKAEVFEDALATVSRRLAAVAKAQAAEIRAARLEAARANKPTKPAPKAAPKRRSGTQGAKPPARAAKAKNLRTPRNAKINAAGRATQKRSQARRDSKGR